MLVRLLQDLPPASREAAWTAFVSIYEASFPDPDERQDPDLWRKPANQGPVSAVLLALDAADASAVLGGVVVELYPESSCGLIAYIAVDTTRRRGGVGRQLVDAGIRQLRDLAMEHGAVLQAVFAETEDARHPDVAYKADAAAQRLVFHDRVGARWLDIDYVMPRLRPDTSRDSSLFLITYPHPAVTLNPSTLSLATVEAFLSEYYAAEPPAERPAADDLGRMLGELRELAEAYRATYGAPDDELVVPLRPVPLPAHPTLRLSQVAIGFHFVTVDEIERDGPVSSRSTTASPQHAPRALRRAGKTSKPSALDGYECPIYHSFELDVLSYRFQAAPPIVSACTADTQVEVNVSFPDETTYVSEGLRQTLFGAPVSLRCRASLTHSRFPATGVRIWHLVLAPMEGETLTEFDLVRLISLYYHDHERSDQAGQTAFEIETERLTLQALVLRLSGGVASVGDPDAGTVEFNPITADTQEDLDTWTRLLSALYLTTVDDQDGFRELEDLYRDPASRSMIKACCGIVSGLFDYDRLSLAEVQDTLAPDSSAGPYAVWLNRATLANIDLYDEMLERCGRTIGLSPYLILPHAVLLHNEFITDCADEIAQAAIVEDDIRAADNDASATLEAQRQELVERVHALETHRRAVDRALSQEYVPNVFHYAGERELYEVGTASRGALDRRQGVERLAVEIHARLLDARERLTVFDRDRDRDAAQRAKQDAEREREQRAAEREAEQEEARLSESRRAFGINMLGVLLGVVVVLDVVAFFSDPAQRRLLWPPTGWTAGVGLLLVLSILALVAAFPRRSTPGGNA